MRSYVVLCRVLSAVCVVLLAHAFAIESTYYYLKSIYRHQVNNLFRSNTKKRAALVKHKKNRRRLWADTRGGFSLVRIYKGVNIYTISYVYLKYILLFLPVLILPVLQYLQKECYSNYRQDEKPYPFRFLLLL